MHHVVRLLLRVFCRSQCCNKSNATKEGTLNMSEAKKQLEVFHDPFSPATSQPKIPDGKVSESVGVSYQTTGTLTNAGTGGEDIMHIVLYPGLNAGFIAKNTGLTTQGTRDYFVAGYSDAGNLNYANMDPVSRERYVVEGGTSMWRIVSQGLVLSLLNAQDEDDGWWEAIRFQYAFDSDDWKMTTTNNGTSLTSQGCVAPYGYFGATGQDLPGTDIASEPSYCTGLLRDLHQAQFNLVGTMDHHDFTRVKEDHMLTGTQDLTAVDLVTNLEGSFKEDAGPAVQQLVTNLVDQTYDAVYIRLHCRPQASGGSQIHYDLVSNQELYYEPHVRDSRYHTIASNIGLAAAAHHGTLRRLRGKAAF